MIDRERSVLERLAARLMGLLERLDDEHTRLQQRAAEARTQAQAVVRRQRPAPPEPVGPMAGEIMVPAIDEVSDSAPRILGVIEPELAIEPEPEPVLVTPKRDERAAFAPVRPVLILEDDVAVPRPVATTKTRPLYHALVTSARAGGNAGPLVPPPPPTGVRIPLPPPPTVGLRRAATPPSLPPVPRPAPHRDTAPLAYR